MNSDRQSVINRLNRIEGQVKGIRRMIEEEQSCVEILMQIAAVKAAVSNVGALVFQTHFRICLETAIAEQDAGFIEEAMKTLGKYID